MTDAFITAIVKRDASDSWACAIHDLLLKLDLDGAIRKLMAMDMPEAVAREIAYRAMGRMDGYLH